MASEEEEETKEAEEEAKMEAEETVEAMDVEWVDEDEDKAFGAEDGEDDRMRGDEMTEGEELGRDMYGEE